MLRKVRIVGTETTFEGVTYPSVVALHRAWQGDKPTERTFGSKFLKWTQRNPGVMMLDADIRQLFRTRAGTHGLRYRGVAYNGPKDLYRAYMGEKLTFGGFWTRLSEFKRASPGKALTDSDIDAMMLPDWVYYRGTAYPSFAKAYRAIQGHKIVLHRFIDNVRGWQKANPEHSLSDEVLEQCCWFYRGAHVCRYQGNSYGNLKALYDTQPQPKCLWGTFANRVRKLEAQRELADEDYSLLLQPQAKVKFFKGILYRWTHLRTEKVYIGISSQTLKERTRLHHRQAKDGTYSNPLSLQATLAKDGLDAFSVEVLGEFFDEDAMKSAEERAVREYDCLAPKGFNLQEGGRSWTKQGTDVEFEGVTYPSYSALAQAFGITEKLLDGRRRMGWALSDALNTPPFARNASSKPVTVQGVDYPSIRDLAKAYGIRYTTIYNKLDLGWSIEDALGLTNRTAKTRKAVTVQGIQFKTISEASRHFGKNPREVFWKMGRGQSIEQALGLSDLSPTLLLKQQTPKLE